MGKAARFACILVPMTCTLISLVTAILLLLAGTNKNISGLSKFYLLQADLRAIDPNNSFDLPGSALDGRLDIKTGVTASGTLDLPDFYAVYLWNHCYGEIKDDNSTKTEKCEKAKFGYGFDIEKIIDEADPNANFNLPSTVRNAQKAVNAWSKVMGVCYILGGISTALTFIFGWFGLLSRWGSCVTTLFASCASCFLLIAAIGSTALAYVLKGAFNKAIDFGVDITVGRHWIATTWVCAAAAMAAGWFWFLSTCCCSGKRDNVMKDKKGKKGTQVEHAPYTYQRVASPYGTPTTGQTTPAPQYGMPMQTYGKTGYEPMRYSHA